MRARSFCLSASLTVGATICVAVAGAGCLPECESFNDCDPGELCTRDSKCVVDERPSPLLCTAGGDTRVLKSLGLPQGSFHYTCDLPAPAVDGPKFVSAEGPEAIVNGGSIVLMLDFEGVEDLAGRTLVFAFEDDGIVFRRTLPNTRLVSPLKVELFALRNAPPGINTLRIGVENDQTNLDEGKIGVGPYLALPLTFIPVRGGDVQVSISWDNTNDVDLHVVDPSGEEIFYGSRDSASGGHLDLDSSVGCSEGPQNENIYWETGTAPTGHYIVRVDMYQSCTSTPTAIRVTRLLHETDVLTTDLVLTAADADSGGEGSGQEVFQFDFP